MAETTNSILKPASVRHNNYRSVFLTIKELESCSVSHITQRLDLSKTAISKTINILANLGYILSTGKGSSSGAGGKRPELYSVSPNYKYTCCISFYNENTIVEIRNFIGAQAYHKTFDSPESCTTLENFVEFCYMKIIETFNCCGITSDKLCGVIIISDQDKFTEDKGILQILCSLETGEDRIKSQLSKALGTKVAISIENSKDMRGYAELRFDKCRKNKTVVIISVLIQSITGCVICDGMVLNGANGLLGSVAHITTDYSMSKVCSCGRRGCFASVCLQGPILEEIKSEIENGAETSLTLLRQSKSIKMSDIIDASIAGDKLAVRHMDFVLENYVRLFQTIQLTLNPDEVILQIGPYSRGLHYKELNQRFEALKLPESDKPLKISTSEIDPMEAAFIGAADYCIDTYLSQPHSF